MCSPTGSPLKTRWLPLCPRPTLYIQGLIRLLFATIEDLSITSFLSRLKTWWALGLSLSRYNSQANPIFVSSIGKVKSRFFHISLNHKTLIFSFNVFKRLCDEEDVKKVVLNEYPRGEPISLKSEELSCILLHRERDSTQEPVHLDWAPLSYPRLSNHTKLSPHR